MLALRPLLFRSLVVSSSTSPVPQCRHSHSSRYPAVDADTTLDASAIERLKKRTRGGQNLSLRYRRLEQSLRWKEALQRDIRARESEAESVETRTWAGEGIDDGRYFHGFEITTRPKAPESDECCMSGCAVCVYDLCEEDLGAYAASLDGLRATLVAKGIPEAAWPESVRVLGRRGDDGGGGSRGATLSAFEALEKALEDKRAKVEPE
ncbi:hypothetical protein B0H11DRAFT_2279510 [Mycena galericulata]|nr:hypothetical protein B0H11DRAFT_2279510 [Mycena galericulata]